MSVGIRRATAIVTAMVIASIGGQVLGSQRASVAHARTISSPKLAHGLPGVAMGATKAGAHAAALTIGSADSGGDSYSHSPTPNAAQDLAQGAGPIMPNLTIYLDFWLPTGQHYESTAAGDTNYESLLTRWVQDVGSTQYHNLLTQYGDGSNTISNTVTFGGSWVDTATAYPHAGTTADPLQDADVRTEVHNAVTTNNWTEDINHIVVVFTATGIQECKGTNDCTDTGGTYCGYHWNFTDGSNDAVYSFMSFDNFTHLAGKTCNAGDTASDTDPNRGTYPNGDKSADVEINTLSHEIFEAESDPHVNGSWSVGGDASKEIGDVCNFNFAPRNDNGADVYLNGHPYIVQQEWSNAVHTCAMDLPTNGFCAGSVSQVCAPTTSFTKSVDNSSPRVTSSVNYTLTLNNTNDTAAETNLALTDTVPSGYTVTALSAPSATSSSNNATSVTVNYDTLPVHQSRTVTITATVPQQAGTKATNCGSLAGSDLIGTALSTQTSNPCADTTPVKIPTVLTYNGATTGDYNDQATVSATLTDDSSNPISGKTIYFTLNSTETCNGLTDANGLASCGITPGEMAGSYTIGAAFTDASDPKYGVSSTSSGFTVTLEESTTTYTGPLTILQAGSGVTLKGLLLEDGTTPIAGRTLTLGLGGQTCTGTTDATGTATCTLTFTGALGPEALSASFTSDGYYQSSSDTSKTATVFAFPSRGAFTLGNLTVASAGNTALTWWADNWNQLNTVSGGPVPSSFKGFAATVSLPTSTPPSSCGSNWQTLPGNSPPPTSGVPSYMGVLVTSRVTKTGNGVAGNTVHIVVVRVNPGYAPNPSSHGTGTIVATYC